MAYEQHGYLVAIQHVHGDNTTESAVVPHSKASANRGVIRTQNAYQETLPRRAKSTGTSQSGWPGATRLAALQEATAGNVQQEKRRTQVEKEKWGTGFDSANDAQSSF